MTDDDRDRRRERTDPRHDWADTHDRGGLATLWSDTIVYAGRNIAHIRQIPEKLLDVTVQPLMFVLLFAYVFGGAIGVSGGSYREYIIAGILMQSLAFGLTGPATAIATDLTEGVIDRFRSLPATRTAYLLGHYVAELGRHGAVDRGAARCRPASWGGAPTPTSATSPGRCCSWCCSPRP